MRPIYNRSYEPKVTGIILLARMGKPKKLFLRRSVLELLVSKCPVGVRISNGNRVDNPEIGTRMIRNHQVLNYVRQTKHQTLYLTRGFCSAFKSTK